MRNFFAASLVSVFILSGCAGVIHELADDSAVVGATGFWFALGVSPSPVAGGLPTPTVSVGYGTLWRIGKHDNVTVEVNSEGGQDGAKAQLKIDASNGAKTP
jgi:hypothetical protein